MKLGNLVEKIINIITIGQGKKLATWVAKKMGYKKCDCDDRKNSLNKIKIERW
tara:strand:+ start:416 stop:574 length:159 start_codon:yes stop_codon:yes gene_type:complete